MPSGNTRRAFYVSGTDCLAYTPPLRLLDRPAVRVL